jgi:hypothetical protein
MKRGDIQPRLHRPARAARFLLVVFLTCLGVCIGLAILPEKPGVRIPVTCANGKVGYIDASGRMVISPRWDRADAFSADGTAAVIRDERRIHIERTPAFPFLRFIRRTGSVALLIDRSGRVVGPKPAAKPAGPPPPEFDEAGMAMIRDHHGVRWIKADGSPAFAGSWTRGLDFRGNDPAAVVRSGRWGFIDRTGKLVIAHDWDETCGFDGSGRAIVALNDRYGCIDRSGNIVVPLTSGHQRPFDEYGLSIKGGGVVDRDGRVVIPSRYEEIDSFDSFGMARAVMRTRRAGWINRKGDTVIPFQYLNYGPGVWNDLAVLPVHTEAGSGLIDRRGKTVVPPGKSHLAPAHDPLEPSRFWIVTVPPPWRPAPSYPRCYDQDGLLIWEGNTWTRSQFGLTAGGGFTALSLIAAAIAFTTRGKAANHPVSGGKRAGS